VLTKPRFRLAAILFLLAAFSATQIVSAQTNPPQKVRQAKQTPEGESRRTRAERDDAYTRWVKDDVPDIITDAERQAFDQLKTNGEREQFIHIFWSRRDPTPDTEENEFREQHYERIAYANEHFGSGKPGRLTDRGKIYIKFGRPDEVEAHPAGGVYQRMSYEGGGSATIYPFERWFYRYLPGVGSGIEIEFVDPTGSGEFRIANDAKEKEVFGRMTASTPASDATYIRQQDSPFARMDLRYRLESAPEIDSKFTGSDTRTPAVDDNALEFDIRADYFKLSDNRVITSFTVQAENRDLVFRDSGGLQTAKLNIVARISNLTERRVGSFEDSVTTTATPAELSDAQNRRSAYSKVVVLEPGHYRVDMIVRDVSSGATGVRHFGFQVPKYEAGRLSSSSMILAAKLENVADTAADRQFVIGQTKVIPNLTGSYRRGQAVGIYLQLYNAGIDQTTLRPSVDVEYALLKEGKELGKQIEDWRGIDQSSERLTLARLLDTKGFAPGTYEVAVRVHDRVSGQSLNQAAKFTVLQ
jgi:GWxTD domain-containing protein